MEDTEIVELFWKRESSAIHECEKKYFKYCYSISYNILKSNEDSEECVNDALLRTWNSIPPKRPVNLSTYLGKIVRNLSIDRYETRRAIKRGGVEVDMALSELEGCLPSGGGVEDEVALSDMVNGFLSGLKPNERIIFMKRYWALCSVKEIAQWGRMSESKVTSMLFRTRKKLRDYLVKEGVSL